MTTVFTGTTYYIQAHDCAVIVSSEEITPAPGIVYTLATTDGPNFSYERIVPITLLQFKVHGNAILHMYKHFAPARLEKTKETFKMMLQSKDSKYYYRLEGRLRGRETQAETKAEAKMVVH